MKRNSKKVLAILLALVMILGQIPVLSSAAEDGDHVILHHPTYDQPYVEVTGSPTGYQWYYDTYVEVYDTAVGEVTGENQVLVSALHGTWDAENGVYKSASWEEGQHLLTLEFADLEEGEWIFIPEFHGYIEDVFMTTSDCYDKGDGYYIDIRNYEDPTVIVLSIDPSEDNELGEFSVAPVVCRDEEQSVAIEGQNKAAFELTEPLEENVYCVVTYQNGNTIISESVYLGYYCYSHPTWKNPTALFTWDEYITGYQWYWVEEKIGTFAISPHTNGYGRDLHYESGFTFDAEIDQYVALIVDESINYTSNSQLYLQKGDTVTFTMSEGYDGTATGLDYAKGEDHFPLTLENGAFTYTTTEETLFEFSFTDDAEFTFTVSVTGQYTATVPVEGETSNTLKSKKLGDYVCVATYLVEDQGFYLETSMRLYLEITNQPTQEDPTVTVNFPDQVAKYQWCTREWQNKTLYVVPYYAGEGYFIDSYQGQFDTDTNEWYPYSAAEGEHRYIQTWVETREGATLTITVTCDDFAGSVFVDGEELTGQDGVYTCTSEWHTQRRIEIEAETDFRATIAYTGAMEVSVPVEGQTTATLTSAKYGFYHCEITGTDGFVLESELVEYYYEFIQHPTEEKPEVSVNFADQVKSYQWYQIVREEFTGYLTEEQAEDLTDYYADIQEDGTWKSVEEEPFKHVVMIMTGEATIKLDIPEGATVTGLYKKLEDGSYTYHDIYGLMLIIHAEEAFTVKPLVTVNTRDDVAVEGQNSATYTGPKTGTYYCEVEYKDGKKIVSGQLTYDPYIEEEPTEEEPTVKVSDTEQVKSYQWFIYKETKKSEALKPEHVTRSYNFYKNNKWQSAEFEDGIHGVIMSLMAADGDKLTLELPDDIDFEVNVDGGTYKDGVVTADDSSVTLYVIAEQSFELTANWDYTDYSFEPVAGQTSDTLTPQVPGYYYCVVTYQDGTELKTDALDYSQRIQNQPTDEAPIVQMLWPELVEKYQWFKVTYPAKNVTNATQATDTVIPGQAIDATYSDGVWYSTVEESDVYLLSFDVKSGEVIRVTTVGDTPISAVYYLHDDYFWGDIMEYVGNGVYEFTVTEDMPVRINIVYSDVAATTDGVKVEVESMKVGDAVQGQNAAVFTGSAGDYICVITDKDGVEYTTDIISVSDYYLTKLPEKDDFTVQVNDPDSVESYQWYVLEEVLATRPAVPINPADDEVEAFYSDSVIFHNNNWYAPYGEVEYFGFEVSVGDEIIITPDANFTGELGLQMRASYAEIQQKDGSYIITVTEDVGMVAVYMTNNEKYFTFTAAVKGTKMVAKAVEGAVSTSFEAKETGEYFCVVTMKDGTKLTSTTVKYEKPAVPPVTDDPIPPTGEGMTVAMLIAVAALAMSAVMALGFDTKRKF